MPRGGRGGARRRGRGTRAGRWAHRSEVPSFDAASVAAGGSGVGGDGGLYAALAGAGLAYGADFQGLRGVWRRGDELFAEAQLPEGVLEGGFAFGLHPALLDGACTRSRSRPPEGRSVALPFSWSGVSSAGVGATTLRVRFERVRGERASRSRLRMRRASRWRGCERLATRPRRPSSCSGALVSQRRRAVTGAVDGPRCRAPRPRRRAAAAAGRCWGERLRAQAQQRSGALRGARRAAKGAHRRRLRAAVVIALVMAPARRMWRTTMWRRARTKPLRRRSSCCKAWLADERCASTRWSW